ncbi:MAG: hypothetical protein WC820_01545 [Spirochaetales bacterium]|jgi:hypothetical protein
MSLNVKVNLGQNLLPTAAGVTAANAIGGAAGATYLADLLDTLFRLPTAGGAIDANAIAAAVGLDLADRIVSILTTGGYSISPAIGSDNLDNIADGASYGRPTLAGASAASTIGAAIGASVREKIKAIFGQGDLLISVSTPVGFLWTSHPLVGHIWTDGNRNYRTDYDVSAKKPSGKTYYISPTGNNSNDGLTPDTPFATLAYAVAKSDVVLIKARTGLYTQSKVMNVSGYINKSVGIIQYGDGDVTFSTHEALSWTLASGFTYTYKATLASDPIEVLDTRSINVLDPSQYKNLAKVASIAAVEATPGSYFWDGTDVYVRLDDDAVPSSSTWVLPSVGYNLYIYNPSTAIKVYLEGITLYGGSHGGIGIDGITGTELYGKSVKQFFSFREGIRIKSTPTVIFQNCESAWNPNDDGLNYHSVTGPKVHAVEIDCRGHHNGYRAALDNNNGSTIHDGNSIIRLNCSYWANKGPNVADVHTLTQSWILGGCAFDSDSGPLNLGPVDYAFNDGNPSIWMEGCRAYSSAKSAIFGTATDIVAAKVRNCNFEIAAEVGALSSLVKY